MRFIIIIASIAILASSCRGTRKIQTAISKSDSTLVNTPAKDTLAVVVKEDSAKLIKDVLAKMDANHIDFTTFSAKLDVDYVGSDGKKENVNAKLQMYKDSIIWVSITGLLNIEGVRAIVTRDSVKILNKLDKKYTARSVAYLQEVSGLPLDLAALQNLLVGNPVFVDTTALSYTKDNNKLLLLSRGELFKHLLTLTENDNTLIFSKLDDLDVKRNRTSDLSYDSYENKKGVNFSTKRRIAISDKTKLDIKLDFKNYSFNETLSFPFSVPKNYKRN
jgi:hypothetical protein